MGLPGALAWSSVGGGLLDLEFSVQAQEPHKDPMCWRTCTHLDIASLKLASLWFDSKAASGTALTMLRVHAAGCLGIMT